MESEAIRVSIFDQVYHLKSGTDKAYMQEVASYVDEKMHSIAAKTQTVDSFRVAVLAALHIADELLRLREEYERLRCSVEAKSVEYASLLDQVLETPAPVGAAGAE